MSKTKKKTYENWTLKQLKSTLMERMGDLFCFVWDARQPVVEDMENVMKQISKTSNKCAEILTEVERRNLGQV